MKLFTILIGFALILATTSSSESKDDDDGLINIMFKILNTNLYEEIPMDQIPPNSPKSTTLSVTPEMMSIVQKMRDHFGSAWNRKN